VTHRFGNGHAGVDVACSIGAGVHAPVDMRVTKVGDDADGGFVVANTMRDDGTFDGDGYRVFFARLGEIDVVEGAVVRRGEIVARAATTGHAGDTRFHFGVEWVDGDRAFVVDPLALVPEAMMTRAANTNVDVDIDAANAAMQVTTIAEEPVIARFATGDEGTVPPPTTTTMPATATATATTTTTAGDPLDGIV
jgi:hypothetical protein